MLSGTLLNLYPSVFWITTITDLELFVNQNPKENWIALFKMLLPALTRSSYRSRLSLARLMRLNVKDSQLSLLRLHRCSGAPSEGLSVFLMPTELFSSLLCSLKTPFQRNKIWQYPAAVGAKGAHLLLSILLSCFIFFQCTSHQLKVVYILILPCSPRIQGLL